MSACDRAFPVGCSMSLCVVLEPQACFAKQASLAGLGPLDGAWGGVQKQVASDA